jgi:hypothetical protein
MAKIDLPKIWYPSILQSIAVTKQDIVEKTTAMPELSTIGTLEPARWIGEAKRFPF